jgi:hypothetical protein
LFLPQILSSSSSPSSSTSLSPKGVHSDSIVKKSGKKTKCFICSRQVDFNNELMMSLSRLCEKYTSNLDIIYCNHCLDGFNNEVYEDYKRRFMSIS